MHAFPAASTFDALIRAAVAEDLGSDVRRGDVTSLLTVPADQIGVGTLFQKSPGVVAGLPIVEFVCQAFDPKLNVEFIPGFHLNQIEGRFSQGKMTPLLRIRGPMRSVLAAERTVLNFLQHLSGVASLTRKFVDKVAGTSAQIVDTRKTLPGYRALDKYAVRVGGGANHRIGLFDMVLVKDNHLAQLPSTTWSASLTRLIAQSKAQSPTLPIQIEAASFEQFEKIIAMAGVDLVLLDNMDCATMRRCVEHRNQRGRQSVGLEASGNVNLDTVAEIARTGVDRISVGALTHSAPALDISMEIEVV